MATVSDQEVKNDDVLYFIFAKESGGWEELQVDSLTRFGGDSEEPSGMTPWFDLNNKNNNNMITTTTNNNNNNKYKNNNNNILV